MSQISDAKYEELKARLNNAIHEIVFACHHLEDDQLDDTATCLCMAQHTICNVADEIVALEKVAEGGRR